MNEYYNKAIESLNSDLENAYYRRSRALKSIKEWTDDWMEQERTILDILEALDKLKEKVKV